MPWPAKHLRRSAAFGCLQAHAARPLLCAFGRGSLYVKIRGNGPGDSNRIGHGDGAKGEGNSPLLSLGRHGAPSLISETGCDVFDVEPANGVA